MLKHENNDLSKIGNNESVDISLGHEIDNLMGSLPLSENEIGDRCFSLIGGRVIFGILLGEQQDSFLVALASTLVNTGQEVEGRLMTNSPVMRLFKSGVAFMCIPELEFRQFYYRHLLTLTKIIPEFFTSKRIETLKATIFTLPEKEQVQQQNRSSSASDSAKEKDDNPVVSSPYHSTTRH